MQTRDGGRFPCTFPASHSQSVWKLAEKKFTMTPLLLFPAKEGSVASDCSVARARACLPSSSSNARGYRCFAKYRRNEKYKEREIERKEASINLRRWWRTCSISRRCAVASRREREARGDARVPFSRVSRNDDDDDEISTWVHARARACVCHFLSASLSYSATLPAVCRGSAAVSQPFAGILIIRSAK